MRDVANIFRKSEYSGLDAIILNSKANKFYMGAKYSSRGFVILSKMVQDPIILVDYRSYNHEKSSPTYVLIAKDENPFEKLAEVLSNLKAKTIGFEGGHMTYNEYEQLSKILKHATLKNVYFDNERMIKDENEISLIKKACEISDQAFKNMMSKARLGMRESDLANILVYEMRQLGASGEAFETIVLSGTRTTLPHGKTSDRIIEKGDIVLIDFGANYQDYKSDCTRTFFFGQPNEKLKEIYEIVRIANEKVLQEARPGMTMEEIDALAREYISNKGYGDDFIHHLGHGIGIEAHEGIRFAKGVKDLLQNNMVMSNEPGIYIDGLGGVRIEDTVLATGYGLEALTKLDKKLHIIGLGE